MKRRIFVSSTSSQGLDPERLAVKAAIIDEIRRAGFIVEEFFESGSAANLAWSFENVEKVMATCVGAVVIGFPRWQAQAGDVSLNLVGEYNHYEGAVAITHRLPVLLLAERGVENRGIVWRGAGRTITYIPEDAGPEWTSDPDFAKRFDAWQQELDGRFDIFLGYCSQNAGTAALIENRLTKAGATVLNYQMDFRAGGTILSEIADASDRCSAGVFLFAENDPLEGKSGMAAPRDNVVFEAGYFMSRRGHDRCLIIRQGEAKMPADLGGAIYLHLDDANDVSPIESGLSSFLDKNL